MSHPGNKEIVTVKNKLRQDRVTSSHIEIQTTFDAVVSEDNGSIHTINKLNQQNT